MQSEQAQKTDELSLNLDDNAHIPFDGFVNVNDIVQRRRQLRTAEFNTHDQIMDAANDFTSL